LAEAGYVFEEAVRAARLAKRPKGEPRYVLVTALAAMYPKM
jgi:hypothetical protein